MAVRLAAVAGFAVLLVAAALSIVAPGRSSPATSASPAILPTASPAAVPLEAALSVLVVDLGPNADQPGVSPQAPGGVTPKGPTSFAIDDEWIYLWDQAKGRLLLYETRPWRTTGRPAPLAVALPAIPASATGLLAANPNDWYFHLEQDNGTIAQQFRVRVDDPRGPQVSTVKGDASIYPRPRALRQLLGLPKGQDQELGRDALGNRYVRHFILSGAAPDQSVEIRRVRESDGAILAVDRRPAGSAIDSYVAENGGVYELRWDDALPPRRAEITQLLAPIPPPTACPSLIQAAIPPFGVYARFPTRTAADVRAGIVGDLRFRHTLEDIAGVRQDSNPLRDQDVPRCAIDVIAMGEPVFVRSYPSTAGLWYVPLLYQGRQLMLAHVGRDEAGFGVSGGSSSGQFPPMSLENALQVGGAATDRAISAELVFARPRFPRASLVAWRVVRTSGAVFYVFPGFPGAGPDGLIAPESEVELGS